MLAFVMLDLEWVLSFLLLGLCVGFIAGLLGVGGGGVMVPILATIFLAQGVSVEKVMHLALGTSMASIIFTSISSMRAHNSNDAVMWKIVKSMGPGVLLGAFFATFFASKVESIYLAIFFSIFMAYVSLQMFLNKKPQPDKNISGNKEVFFVGTGIGAVSALVSIGGGSLTVPYLVWRNTPIKKAVGTSAAIGLPISIAGTVGYLINGWSNSSPENHTVGFIYIPAVIFISLASSFSAPYGVKLAHYLPVPVLKKIFSLLLIMLSVKMLVTIM